MDVPILTVYDDGGNEIAIPAISGADGKSAYESAQDGGYTGTEAQFNTDLAAVSGKADKPTTKTTMDAVAAVNTQYFLGAQSGTLNITLPSGANAGEQIWIVWYNGATAVSLNISGSSGAPVLDVDYIPSANTRSEINALWDGTYWAVLTNEQAVPGVTE